MLKFIVNLSIQLPLVHSVNPSLLRCGSILFLNQFSKNVYEKQAFWHFPSVHVDLGVVGLCHGCTASGALA